MTLQQQFDLSIGRYWGSADRAELTEHPEGDATVNLFWTDGARLSQYEYTQKDARETLRRLGFLASAS